MSLIFDRTLNASRTFRASLPAAIDQLVRHTAHTEATRLMAENKFVPKAERLMRHVRKKKDLGQLTAEIGYVEKLVATLRAFITIRDMSVVKISEAHVITEEEIVLSDSLSSNPKQRIGKDYIKPASLYVLYPNWGPEKSFSIGAEILVSLLGEANTPKIQRRFTRLSGYWNHGGRMLCKTRSTTARKMTPDPMMNFPLQWLMTPDDRVKRFSFRDIHMEPIGMTRLEIKSIAREVIEAL